jgi:hypothetical protein
VAAASLKLLGSDLGPTRPNSSRAEPDERGAVHIAEAALDAGEPGMSSRSADAAAGGSWVYG